MCRWHVDRLVAPMAIAVIASNRTHNDRHCVRGPFAEVAHGGATTERRTWKGVSPLSTGTLRTNFTKSSTPDSPMRTALR